MPFLAGVVTPQDYGAAGNGTTDDTAACQAAINAVAAAGGGVLFFPAGTYLITPSGSPAVGLSTLGADGIRFVGASANSSVLKKGGNGVLLQLSGTGTGSAAHCSFCSVQNLGFNGNGLTGLLVQAYYADDLLLEHVYFNNSADVILGTAELWDSRFINCVFGGSGSTTANASTPNVLIQNSAASSGFGLSTDSSNQLYFYGCRWEAFHTGAVWVQQGPGNVGGPNDIFFTDCKFESSVINGGPHISVDANSRAVHIKHAYLYSGGFNGGYSTAQDLITYSCQFGTLDDILLSNGGSATVANGITLNAPAGGQTVKAENISATYSTAPTGGHINFGTTTGNFQVINCETNVGNTFVGNTPSNVSNTALTGNSAAGVFSVSNSSTASGANTATSQIVESNASSNSLGIRVAGDTQMRYSLTAQGAATYGPGTSLDYTSSRIAAAVHGFSKSLQIGSATDLGDGGTGVLKIANAAVIPTANPVGGAVVYARSGGLITRDPAGDILPLIAGPESAATTGALAESVPRTQVSASSAFTSGTLLIQSVFLPAGVSVGHIGFGTGTTAGATMTHWWAALLDSTYKQQAHSADQTSGALAASTWLSLAMATPYVTAYSGTYYLALMIAATTVPTILQSGVIPAAQFWTGTSHPTPVPNGASSAGLTTPGTDGTTTYTAPSAASAPYYLYAAA